jgi:hypothetical protein
VVTTPPSILTKHSALRRAIRGRSPCLAVYDNVVPQPLIAAVWNLVQRGWAYGDTSNPHDALPFWGTKFCHNPLDGDVKGARSPIVSIDAAPAEVGALWNAVRRQLPGDYDVRYCYANGQTYGLDGNIHVDATDPGSYTALVYMNPLWKSEWGGETLFYSADREHIVGAVMPRPGRAAFWDGRIPHWGRAPSRYCASLRVTVAFHLRLRAE